MNIAKIIMFIAIEIQNQGVNTIILLFKMPTHLTVFNCIYSIYL